VTEIHIPYGEDTLSAVVCGGECLGTLDIAPAPALPDPDAAMRAALEQPIGLERPLADVARPGERVCVIVSDSFRHTGVHELLPALLEHLARAGVRDGDIRFVFATGTHRPPTDEERVRILGEAVHARFGGQAFAHDPNDRANLVYLGETPRGTPVWINRRVAEADRVVVTGAAVLHYFGGFGGGRKSIVPGVAGVETISANHARNLHPAEDRLNPAVRIGVLDGNPVAEDMEDGARLCRCDLLVNTVLNREGRIAGLYAGALTTAHRRAAQHAIELFAVRIPRRADLVVASAGGTKNWVQSHKALFNAHQAVRPGGRIVLAARAPEGFGGNKFETWVRLGSRGAIIQELRKRAEINGQTALSTLEKAANTRFVTELSAEQVTVMGGRKAADLQCAISEAIADLAAQGIANPSFYVMPSAAYTVPFPEEEGGVPAVSRAT
jgi:nickel-dependent lactate racemase